MSISVAKKHYRKSIQSTTATTAVAVVSTIKNNNNQRKTNLLPVRSDFW